MKPVHADFVIRRGPPRWLWIALGLFWLLPISLELLAWKQQAQREEVERRLAVEAEARAAARIRTPPPQPPYLQSALEMLREREMTALLFEALRALETVSMPGVVVTSIDMVPSEKAIRAVVSVAKASDPMAYLELLNEGNPADSTGAQWKLSQMQTGPTGEHTITMAFVRGR